MLRHHGEKIRMRFHVERGKLVFITAQREK